MCAEDAREDGVDVAELALQVEGAGEGRGIQKFCDALIGGDAVPEVGFGLPRGHGIFLDGDVGVVVGHALFDQILQKLAAADQNVFAVGDPDQAIYRFRGASSAAFVLFQRHFSGAKLIKALRDFACRYADQTEADYAKFMDAIKRGKIKVAEAEG